MIILKDATYVDYKSLEFTHTNILVEAGVDGGIRFLTEEETLQETHANILDCNGKIVTHAFANAHHHAYSALARGMPAPPKNPENFHEVLQYVWWRLDKALDREIIEASALYTAMQCAKNGVNFVIDHHASPNAVAGSLEAIAGAFDKVGVSHLLCYEISDRDGKETARQGLKETGEYLSSGQGLVGLHASFTVEEETLKKAADLARKYNSGIHVHVAEDPVDQKITQRASGKKVIERFRDAGICDLSKTILAHCLYLDGSEKEIVRNSPAWVVQNPESNLNNNVGFFNGTGMGENIMLGTDGMHSDMIRSAQSAYFSGLAHENLSPDLVYQRLRRVHDYLRANRFAGDNANNLVVLDYDSPTAISGNNFTGHFIYGFENRHIRDVISNGKLILHDRRLTTVDEDDALRFIREMGNKLWKNMNNF